MIFCYHSNMQKNILITGNPKSGKSTILRKLISYIPNKVGLLTNEILGKDGRVGFESETHTGKKTRIAHVDFKTEFKVSKYFADTKNLESLIPEVSNFNNEDFLYLEKIGQMQVFSNEFKNLVVTYLNSPNTCLATISQVYEDGFTKNIKERDDIILVEISAENREKTEQFLSQLFKKIEKAKKYISEPERFMIQDSQAELRSEHGTRKLLFKNGKWQCDCDFSEQYNICSHIIAINEITK